MRAEGGHAICMITNYDVITVASKVLLRHTDRRYGDGALMDAFFCRSRARTHTWA